MSENSPVQGLQKLARIWSSRLEREIAVQIYYDRQVENGCTIYRIGQVEELD